MSGMPGDLWTLGAAPARGSGPEWGRWSGSRGQARDILRGMAETPAAPAGTTAPPRCALVVRPAPTWLLLNTAAVLGATIGTRPDVRVGPDVPDASGALWPGLTSVVVPVLTAPADLHGLMGLARAAGLDVRAFTASALAARTLEEFAADLRERATRDVEIHGLAIVGPAAAVRRVTRGLAPLGC